MTGLVVLSQAGPDAVSLAGDAGERLRDVGVAIVAVLVPLACALLLARWAFKAAVTTVLGGGVGGGGGGGAGYSVNDRGEAVGPGWTREGEIDDDDHLREVRDLAKKGVHMGLWFDEDGKIRRDSDGSWD